MQQSAPQPEQPPHDAAHRTSDLLVAAVQGESERVTIGEILDALDNRAFGLATLLFAIPSVIPMPPGVPTVVGIALLIVSIQMVLGREDLWLPSLLSKRSFSRRALVDGFLKIKPQLGFIERFAQPRLLFLTGRLATVLIGIVILVMAIVLILPLPPGGNFPPALACAVLGMGLVERDGVIVLLGLVVTVAASIAAVFLLGVLIHYLPAAWDWMASLFPH
ncbi:MAG: exopolysaccharide biosynthesis protein [Hyphomonadaceae bacterium]